ncbi:MAG: DUF4835 family protein [Bacteroidales bacterium]|nr:DUF4835 family protein [Bacteroidales bacterium]
MKIKYGIVVILFLFLAQLSKSQELDCNVRVNSRQVEGTNKQVFENLQKTIFEFMNTTSFTNQSFKVGERIECTLLFTITEWNRPDEFTGKLNIAIRRPVFNTSYNTPLFNWVDKNIKFTYVEQKPIEFNENAFTSNLASLLGYYAYFIIGLDFDSFKKFGGTPYFEKANNILSLAQSSNYKGWKSFESRKNRYWLIENYLNNSYAGVREASYLYHRKGLDKMQDNLEMGRSKITEALELLKRVNEQRPDLFILKLFIEAKTDELVNIYKKASSMQKNKAVEILKELDPANSSTYDQIKQEN